MNPESFSNAKHPTIWLFASLGTLRPLMVSCGFMWFPYHCNWYGKLPWQGKLVAGWHSTPPVAFSCSSSGWHGDAVTWTMADLYRCSARSVKCGVSMIHRYQPQRTMMNHESFPVVYHHQAWLTMTINHLELLVMLVDGSTLLPHGCGSILTMPKMGR